MHAIFQRKMVKGTGSNFRLKCLILHCFNFGFFSTLVKLTKCKIQTFMEYFSDYNNEPEPTQYATIPIYYINT